MWCSNGYGECTMKYAWLLILGHLIGHDSSFSTCYPKAGSLEYWQDFFCPVSPPCPKWQVGCTTVKRHRHFRLPRKMKSSCFQKKIRRTCVWEKHRKTGATRDCCVEIRKRTVTKGNGTGTLGLSERHPEQPPKEPVCLWSCYCVIPWRVTPI